MWILFVGVSVVLLFILIYQHTLYKKLKKEINYISHRLETLSIDSENGFVLLPTENACVKEQITIINRLLQDFYKEKSEFRQKQQGMAQVLTNISHDIRTPLTVLKGNSEMLTEKANRIDVPEDIYSMAVKIDEKVNELIITTNDHFTLSKITSGDFPLKLKKENISTLCRDTILEYYNILEKRQFEVDIQIVPVPIYVNTDRDALQRILKNLIDNAIRHGGDGKYLSFRLIAETEKTIIEIEDHGKGIPVQAQKQIFIRNYTTASKALGNGLGLAIAENLATKIGAELQVYSVPAEKTVFSVIIKS